VIDALDMNKTECKKLESKTSPKLLEIEVPERFTRLATKYGKPVEWLANLACELFADDPPSEIIDLAERGKAPRTA
jgi:hypothetical protein